MTPQTSTRHALSKVPEVTVYFWIIKVLTTGTGEAMSDYLVHTINPYLAVFVGAVVFAIALAIQFSARQYRTWIYWLAVLMVAVFGTMVADALHIGLGIPYAVSAAGFSIALAAVFVTWYVTEKTLSIHSIYTRRREFFYWSTVVATFALGTATGDMTATTLHLGFLTSGILFAFAIMVPAVAYRWLHANPILCFWTAYVLTRPLGASFADWMGVPHSLSGLDLGRGRVALAGLFLIICFVGYLMVTRRDTPAPAAQAPAGAGGTERDGYSARPPYPPSGTSQSGYPQPGGPQPGGPRSGGPQSGYSQSGYGQPGYGQPGHEQAGHGRPGAARGAGYPPDPAYAGEAGHPQQGWSSGEDAYPPQGWSSGEDAYTQRGGYSGEDAHTQELSYPPGAGYPGESGGLSGAGYPQDAGHSAYDGWPSEPRTSRSAYPPPGGQPEPPPWESGHSARDGQASEPGSWESSSSSGGQPPAAQPGEVGYPPRGRRASQAGPPSEPDQPWRDEPPRRSGRHRAD